MKCLICSNTIDDKKDFTVKGPQGQDLDDTVGRLRHFDELGRWTHVTLTAQFSFTQVLLSGHVCPAHKVEPGRLGLVEAAPAAPVQVAAPPAAPSTPTKTQAPAAPTAAAAPQNPATPTVRRKEPQS
jgi:hypothetical protein